MVQIDSRRSSRFRLTPTDRAILGLLQQDARRTISEMAAIVGVSRTTVKDRIDLMRERDVIKRFTIEISDDQKVEKAWSSAFFLIKLRRPVCHLVHSSIKSWPELIGCWSISGDIDMVVLINATFNREIERLRDTLARHPEVKILQTLTILREWTRIDDTAYQRNLDRPNLEPKTSGNIINLSGMSVLTDESDFGTSDT